MIIYVDVIILFQKSGLVVEAPKREITAEELHRTIRMDENGMKLLVE